MPLSYLITNTFAILFPSFVVVRIAAATEPGWLKCTIAHIHIIWDVVKLSDAVMGKVVAGFWIDNEIRSLTAGEGLFCDLSKVLS